MRPKPPVDVIISMSESETLTQTKSFDEVEESKKLNEVEERSRRFVRAKATS